MRLSPKMRGPAVAAFFFAAVGMALAQPLPPRPPIRPAPPGDMMRPPGFMPPVGPGMFPGQGPAISANPEQVRADIKRLLATQPHEVFARLNRDQGVLAPEERIDLARQAVARLGIRVEVSNNNWATRTEVRAACQNVESFDPSVRLDLEVLARLAERRVLSDALFEVRHLAERGPWSEVIERGRGWSKRLRDSDEGAPDRLALQERRAAREALADIVRAGLEREALDALQEGLRTGDLDRLAPGDLPPRLHEAVLGLRGLKVVRELAAESRLDPREVAALKQNLDSFARGLRTLPDSDPLLGPRILQELAVRHFLQGHTQEYRALMPADGPADQAARLLRDMKALTLGKGEIVTAPARQALEEKKENPPVGVQAVMPVAERKTWRPPSRREKAEPSPLDRAAEAGKSLLSRIETDLKSERITQAERTKEARRRIEAAQRRLQDHEEADGHRFAEVAEGLGRALEAAEKVRVRQLMARQQTSRQIIAVLKQPVDPKAARK